MLPVLVRLVAVLAGAALMAALSLVAAPGSAGSRTLSRSSGVDPALLQPLLVPGLVAPHFFGAHRFVDGAGLAADVSAAGAPAAGAVRRGALPDRGRVAAGYPYSGGAPASPAEPGGQPASSTGAAPTGAAPLPTSSAPPTLLDLRQGTTGVGLPASSGPDPAPRAGRPPIDLPDPSAHEIVVVTGIASWYDNGTTAMRWSRHARVRICGPGGCVTRHVTDWGPDGSIYPERVVDLMPADFVRVCGCSLQIGLTQVRVEILD